MTRKTRRYRDPWMMLMGRAFWGLVFLTMGGFQALPLLQTSYEDGSLSDHMRRPPVSRLSSGTLWVPR